MVRKSISIVFACVLLLMPCSETDSEMIEQDIESTVYEHELVSNEAENYTKWVDTTIRTEGSCRDTLIFIGESYGEFYD